MCTQVEIWENIISLIEFHYRLQCGTKSHSLYHLNLNGGMPLVKGSANINLVLTCSMTTFLSLTYFLMARYLMLICLLQLPLQLFFAINTVATLSENILNGLDMESTTLSPTMKLLSQTLCEVASKQEMNSTSIVKVTVNICYALLQETTPPTNMKMYPNIDFWELMQPAKSESK